MWDSVKHKVVRNNAIQTSKWMNPRQSLLWKDALMGNKLFFLSAVLWQESTMKLALL